MANEFLNWLEANELKIGTLKRSQFTDYLQSCRDRGNSEATIQSKQNVVRHYYFFLGLKNNPAIGWLKAKKEHKLPPKALTKEELVQVYEKLNPKSPAEYRNRCILGFILFQGLLRTQLSELRISDVDLTKCEVFVQGQRRSNSRRLKLESIQLMHLYDYLHKYRKEFLSYQNTDTDRFFLSKGNADILNTWDICRKLKIQFPQINNLQHLRASVITNWQKHDGVIEAMGKAGHRYVSSTAKYQTHKYEELQQKLRTKHPLEAMTINGLQ